MDQSSEIVFFKSRFPKDQHRLTVRISSGLTDGITQIAGITTAADHTTARPTNHVGRQFLQWLQRIRREGVQTIHAAFSSVLIATRQSHDHHEAWLCLVVLLDGSNVGRIH